MVKFSRKGIVAPLLLLWVVLLMLSLAGIGWADTAEPKNESGLEEALDGFEDGFEGGDPFDSPFDLIDTSDVSEEFVKVEDNPLRIGGFVRLETEYAYNKSSQNVSKVKPLIFIETDYEVNKTTKLKISGQAYYDISYDIEGKDEFKGSNLDDEKQNIELKDLYFDSKLGEVYSIRIGRQIIAWGDSDYAKITDVVNPRDMTQIGLIDLEDARLQVTSVRFSANFESWSINAVTIHEHPGAKLSGQGSDFDYFTLFRSPGISIKEKDTPDFGFSETSWALKVSNSFNGGDISFIVASTFDDQPYLRYDGFENSIMQFTPKYDKFYTYGISSSMAKGSNLFKIETAFLQDKKLIRNDFLTQISSGLPASQVQTHVEKNQISTLLGIENTQFSTLRLNLETQWIHTLNHNSNISSEENEYRVYFQATKQLMNDALELDLFWVFMNPGQGNILRLSSTYDIFDGFSIQGGLIFYEANDSSSSLYSYREMDRLFLRFKYSF